ncbi:hypothetical protein CRV08_08610 [Halarcobacter ebronensis]|uniref:Uncharacterized protein n=1 Tax=Halarcobacter ebronensis TaxID=1462615 RepID=A0A4Q0YD10_9BACT|nr:hypothetical protein [Halarcobacter ebronensis]RXJ68302.1 hypothetical protein CRV08_08610 [Halarcobacter ebronensis]
MNDSNKEHFDIFPKDGFEIFINCLETQGYVIDSKEESGYAFSSTQLDNMTEEVFYALIEKFNINTDLDYGKNISSTGCYHQEHGSYSIFFNDEIVDYYEAKEILSQYLDNL